MNTSPASLSIFTLEDQGLLDEKGIHLIAKSPATQEMEESCLGRAHRTQCLRSLHQYICHHQPHKLRGSDSSLGHRVPRRTGRD
jgi:hypothetical protein